MTSGESGFESTSEIESADTKKKKMNFSICSALSPTRIKDIKNKNKFSKSSEQQKVTISAQECSKKVTGEKLHNQNDMEFGIFYSNINFSWT